MTMPEHDDSTLTPAAQAVIVYVTTASTEEAERIADEIVGARLAACANILPGMTSVYRWQSELKRDSEVVLLLKTRAALVKRLTERVTELHSYDCPCVVALPVTEGSPAFLRWISDETS